MKKVIAVILALLYIGTSSGAALHMHYCRGKLADWRLAHNNSGTCGSCDTEKSDEKDKACCKDEHKYIKNDTDQKLAEPFPILELRPAVVVADYAEQLNIQGSCVTKKDPTCHAPPGNNSVALYIFQRAFLI